MKCTNSRILLVGTGYMGREYAKVLQAQGREFLAVGRGEDNAAAFDAATGCRAVRGGLEKYLAETATYELPAHAIVAVSFADLEKAASALMAHGVRHILLEKPGAPTFEGVARLQAQARMTGTEIALAYNRRYYASTLAAEEIIEADGGVTSFCFEFTELHKLAVQMQTEEQRQILFFGNSCHVVDMAFHLGGKPIEMNCYRQGTVFVGAGLAERGVLFSYQANWDAPGRWGVEMLTKAHRLILRPLEKLQVQEVGKFNIEFADIDDRLDTEFKPGLYREVQAFMDERLADTRLCSLEEHAQSIGAYKKIFQAAV